METKFEVIKLASGGSVGAYMDRFDLVGLSDRDWAFICGLRRHLKSYGNKGDCMNADDARLLGDLARKLADYVTDYGIKDRVDIRLGTDMSSHPELSIHLMPVKKQPESK